MIDGRYVTSMLAHLALDVDARSTTAERFDRELLRQHAGGHHGGAGCSECPACWTIGRHVRERATRLWDGARGRHEDERRLVLESLVRRAA